MGSHHPVYLAKELYEAYSRKCEGNSLITGHVLPSFDQLHDSVVKCWEAAANAASIIVTQKDYYVSSTD